MRAGYGSLLLAAPVLIGMVGVAAIYLVPQKQEFPVGPVEVATPEAPKMITSKIAESKSGRVEHATFGAGCFWGVEAVFRRTPGVLSTAVGYAGGAVENPTYQQVCTDSTGHAEVVQVTFDPEQVSYDQLLDLFWTNHNPTQLNFQGPDFGTQYRSVVFYHDDAQRTAAEASKQRLAESGKFARPVVTQIEPAPTFYAAEDYHQQYLEKRGLSSCHL